MFILFGRRGHGRVDARGGELANTTFIDFYCLPVIPESSHWVTDSHGTLTSGFPIPLHKRSVAATYLRWYAPAFAAVLLVRSPLFVGVPLAVALLAACAWSWSWLNVRGDLACRRSDFNLLAFGARCDPARMSRGLREELATRLRARWAERGGTRTPEDAARFGAIDASEAILAYGLLRLAGDPAAIADRIVRGTVEAAPSSGPYRDAAPVALVDVHAQVLAAATDSASVSPLAAITRGGITNAAFMQAARAPIPPSKPVSPARVMAIVAVVAALVSTIGLVHLVPRCAPPTPSTIASLADPRGHDQLVTIACDEAHRAGEITDDRHNVSQIYVCRQGGRGLIVLDAGSAGAVPTVVTGILYLPDPTNAWFSQVSATDDVIPIFLETESPLLQRAMAAGAGALGLASLVLAALAWRRFRRGRGVSRA